MNIKDNETLPNSNCNAIQTLDFYKHWTVEWITSNFGAAKIVGQMLKQNERGLIFVVKLEAQWQIETNADSITISDSKVPSKQSLGNDKIEKIQFESYCVYVIKSKVVILNKVNIDGNVYAIDCELQCEKNVVITTQIFVTKNAIIDQKLRQSLSPIEWNDIFHHDVPIQLQCLQDKALQCLAELLFDDAIAHHQEALQLSIDTFGLDHSYVANCYNNLGIAFNISAQTDNALNCHEIALKISLKIFGNFHAWIGNLYDHIGNCYYKKRIYAKAIEYYKQVLNIRLIIFGDDHEDVATSYARLGLSCEYDEQIDTAIEYYGKALHIRKQIFGNTKRVADTYWNLADMLKTKGEMSSAFKCYEEAWKIYSVALGEWNQETIEAKKAAEQTIGGSSVSPFSSL
ncbi:hypothetical protein RFI_04806 [Reticulomyxa filosa]|uniref:Uncharacterized protein n=1 Tax=Reticulomyxa filosa TaxID=46433 RepID=X6P269_RETFI|nr:hypothetical protein RFI_04806 [Reticulomyxa filosa]|eukprot:ETO32311.1 hypothetical protein RFI_04806 [Reticulomyxa filosa]